MAGQTKGGEEQTRLCLILSFWVAHFESANVLLESREITAPRPEGLSIILWTLSIYLYTCDL